MNAKHTAKKPVQNALEQLAEFGRDTAKQAVHDVVETLNPASSLFENPTAMERKQGNHNFTEVNFERLQQSYDKQDSPELQKIRQQLTPEEQNMQDEQKLQMDYHKRVKREEEELDLEKQKEDEEKKRQEAMEEHQKKQKEEEEKKLHEGGVPKGKRRRTILGDQSERKASTELPPEYKPGAGKQ